MKPSRALAAIPIVIEHPDAQRRLDFAAPAATCDEDAPPSLDQLQQLRLGREPVLVAWGAGRDSTAMIIELLARGEPIDMVLFADTGAEKPATYVFVRRFREWLRERSIPCVVVRNRTRRFKHWPAYTNILEECLTNAALPSLAFRGHSCSQKWKIEPQVAWVKTWSLAQEAWAAGCRVVKLVGYDCSPADIRRYAEREGPRGPGAALPLTLPLKRVGLDPRGLHSPHRAGGPSRTTQVELLYLPRHEALGS